MNRLARLVGAVKQGRPPAAGDLPPVLLDALARAESLRGRVMELPSLTRVLTTVRHKEPDRVPVTPIVNAAGRQITGTTFPEYSRDPEKAAEVFCAGYELVGGDLVVVLLDLSVEAEGFGQTILYPENSTAHPDYDDPVIKSVDDYARIRPVRVADTRRMKDFVRLCELTVGRIGLSGLVAGFVFGPLGVLSMMRGAEALFKDCVNHEKEVVRACAAITETLVEFVEMQADVGVGGVAIDSLYAAHTGLPKDMWSRIEGPFCREIAQALRGKGCLVGIHNCGHGVYFDAQIASMEPQLISFAHLPDDCPTVADLKKRYGRAVTLIGYVPTPLLVSGTPRQVMDECRRQIDNLADGGGFILAPGCEYPPNLSLVNAMALVRAAEKYS